MDYRYRQPLKRKRNGNIDSFYVNEETGSYSEIGNEHSTQLDGITNAMRLSIRELAETKADMTNGTYWLYLDNIKVSIANN